MRRQLSIVIVLILSTTASVYGQMRSGFQEPAVDQYFYIGPVASYSFRGLTRTASENYVSTGVSMMYDPMFYTNTDMYGLEFGIGYATGDYRPSVSTTDTFGVFRDHYSSVRVTIGTLYGRNFGRSKFGFTIQPTVELNISGNATVRDNPDMANSTTTTERLELLSGFSIILGPRYRFPVGSSWFVVDLGAEGAIIYLPIRSESWSPSRKLIYTLAGIRVKAHYYF